MARVTLKSQAIVIAQLEAQVAELTTQKGILMSEVTALKSEVQILKESYDEVESQLVAAEAQVKRQGQIIAAQPKTAPPASPKKPAPKPQIPVSEIESQPAVEITDTDRRVWSAFKALPREKRQAYYEFARATVGHLGIHNIVAVREAYLAKQAA